MNHARFYFTASQHHDTLTGTYAQSRWWYEAA